MLLDQAALGAARQKVPAIIQQKRPAARPPLAPSNSRSVAAGQIPSRREAVPSGCRPQRDTSQQLSLDIPW